MKIKYQNYIQIGSRCVYIGFAALWWFVNKQHFILSGGDAQRINLPISLYLSIPILVLVLYALRPTVITWIFIITIFTFGYSLHVYESLRFNIAHMGVKADMLSTAIQMAEYLLVFAFCVLVLYVSGPYVRKKYGTAK